VGDLADGRTTLAALGFKSEFLSEFQRAKKIALASVAATTQLVASPSPLLIGRDTR
jgi:hypothetical protein